MSFLSTIGAAIKNDIAKLLTTEAKYEPELEKVLATIPQTQALAAGLNVMQGIVATVEATYGSVAGTGAQKLAAATQQFLTQIEASGFLSGKKVADIQKYQAAATNIVSNFADLLNATEPA